MVKNLVVIIMSFVLVSCATNERKLFIHPPEGATLQTPNLPVTYEVQDAVGGKTHKLTLPIQHSPELLKVVDGRGVGLGTRRATQADTEFLPTDSAKQTVKPKSDVGTSKPENISYLRGVDLVSELFKKQRFTDALVELAPLIEQYPQQARLYVMKGTIYRKIQEPKSALRAYKKAAELDESNADLQTVIAQLQTEIGSDVSDE